MILFEPAAEPAIRHGELDLGGRRVAARAFAYSGDAGTPDFRFDPLDRRLLAAARRRSGTLLAGPASPGAWAAGFAKSVGPILIEGAAASGAEEIEGAFLAAVRGAMRAGRGAYLLDPPPSGIPVRAADEPIPDPAAPPFAVAIFSWHPGFACFSSPASAELVGLAAGRGVPAGVLWPVIPGWTAGEDFTAPFLGAAARAGARFAIPVAPADDADFRRMAVAARTMVEPDRSDAFFDAMHHSGWEGEMAASLERVRAAVAAAGLDPLPPRPAGAAEPAANVRAAARLERLALEAGADEHRAARLHAAVRWIDTCGRDLGAILREGNFARAFPLGPDLAREAEQALSEVPA